MRTLKEVHASSHQNLDWKSISWKRVKKKVKELQMRIAKAVRRNDRVTFYNPSNPIIESNFRKESL
jgi:hypothetical protein